MKISKKLFIYMLIFITSSLLLLGTLSFFLYYKISTNRLEEEIDASMGRITTLIQDKVNQIDILTEKAEFYSKSSYDLMDDLKKYRNKNYDSDEFYYTQEEVRGIFRTIIYRIEDVNFISLTLPSGDIISYTNGQEVLRYGANVLQDSWYLNAINKEGDLSIDVVKNNKNLIDSTSENNIFISRALYNFYTREFLGVLSVVCTPDYFGDSKNMLPSIISEYTLVNEKGDTIFNEKLENESSNEIIKSGSIPTVGEQLTYSLVIDRSEYVILFHKILIIILAILCIMIIPIVIIIFKFSKQFTKPISLLSEFMSKNKNIPNDFSSFTGDIIELNSLYSEYNNMRNKIDNHNLKILDYERSLITSELNVYKNQIDSHFLYNTLESINSIAEIEEIDDISEMTLSLSKMFRYTSNGFVNQATIAEELKNVEEFINIQQIRFQQNIDFITIVADDKLYSKKIPKIILQPLIENAIYHGFNKGIHQGKLRLFIQENTEYLLIRVIDNGNGIDQEKLEEIRTNLLNSRDIIRLRSKHIGLINIDARIKHLFGDNYGVFIFSNSDKGTLTEVRIPKESELV